MAQGIFSLKQVAQSIGQGSWTGYIVPKWVEYLVVAGGGGAEGGIFYGSGGSGAGGVLQGIASIALGTSYSVTVGSGGAGTKDTTSSSGGNSSFGSIVAIGGGRGGYASGISGGSGGGGGTAGQPSGTIRAGAGTFSQGNPGGEGIYVTVAGGGGGAGAPGSKGLQSVDYYTYQTGGLGGGGVASSITGSTTAFAGGGGGGVTAGVDGGVMGRGGIGGGGRGGRQSGSAAATANGISAIQSTGSGGGGTGGFNINYGGSGGSGMVVIRYLGTIQYFTGGTVTYSNGYIVHTFYSSGTFAPTTPTPFTTTEYQISRSLRFTSANTTYLQRTNTVAGNRRKFTLSFWIKRVYLQNAPCFFSASNNSQSYRDQFFFTTTGEVRFDIYNSGTLIQQITNETFNDIHAWYHIVIALDTTQASNTNGVKIYKNGVLCTLQNNNYTQNAEAQVNNTVEQTWGWLPTYTPQRSDMYLADAYMIDGQQLDPTYFAETNPNTGQWQPKAYTGSYGTNGYFLNFSEYATTSQLGKDFSGNNNNFRSFNFRLAADVTNDSLVDVPTSWGVDTGRGGEVRGNYAVLNNSVEYVAGGINNIPYFYALTNGNLTYTDTDVANSGLGPQTTIMPYSGKWYAEFTIGPDTTQYPSAPFPGAIFANIAVARLHPIGATGNTGSAPAVVSYQASDGLIVDRVYSTIYSGLTYTIGDTISIALDLDNGKVWFGKNGTWLNSGNPSAGTNQITTITTGEPWGFEVGCGASGYHVQIDCNFGQLPWKYQAPTGFKALCVQNLPTPTIGATSATQASKYFNTVLYTGNGGTNTITNVGFQPDFVWTKSRSAEGYNILRDSLRGSTKRLISDGTFAELTDATYGTFTSSGFSLGNNVNHNSSGVSYIARNWYIGGSAVTNTQGSMSAQVLANQTSGISIVTLTIPNSSGSQTYGHGLGASPGFIFAKNLGSTSDWFVWHKSLGNADIRLNNTDGDIASGFTFNSVTSTLVTIGGSDVRAYWGGNTNWVFYNFAEIPGFSRFGDYTGIANALGPFVYCGFKPKFIMIKRSTSSSDGPNWNIFEADRPDTPNWGNLRANLPNTESNGWPIDFLSNGFKIGYAGETNYATKHIFMAFAEMPFKYSTAR